MSIESLRQSAKKAETNAPAKRLPARTKIQAKAASSPATTQPDADSPKDGAAFLHSLLKAHLFMGLFAHVSYMTYDGKNNQVKIAKHRLASPRYFNFCKMADTVVLCVAVAFLTAIAIISAMKTLNLPPFEQQVIQVTASQPQSNISRR